MEETGQFSSVNFKEKAEMLLNKGISSNNKRRFAEMGESKLGVFLLRGLPPPGKLPDGKKICCFHVDSFFSSAPYRKSSGKQKAELVLASNRNFKRQRISENICSATLNMASLMSPLLILVLGSLLPQWFSFFLGDGEEGWIFTSGFLVLTSDDKERLLRKVSMEVLRNEDSGRIGSGGFQLLSTGCRGNRAPPFSFSVIEVNHVTTLVNPWSKYFIYDGISGQLHVQHRRVGIGWRRPCLHVDSWQVRTIPCGRRLGLPGTCLPYIVPFPRLDAWYLSQS